MYNILWNKQKIKNFYNEFKSNKTKRYQIIIYKKNIDTSL